MGAKKSGSKVDTRVTIRFPDEGTAAEFHRQARLAGKRPSPYGAELIAHAMTEPDQRQHDLEMLRHELGDFRAGVRLLKEISEQMTASYQGSDELFEEIQQLRDDVARLGSVRRIVRNLREDLATSVNILLVEAGRVTQEAADQWVKDRLLEE